MQAQVLTHAPHRTFQELMRLALRRQMVRNVATSSVLFLVGDYVAQRLEHRIDSDM